MNNYFRTNLNAQKILKEIFSIAIIYSMKIDISKLKTREFTFERLDKLWDQDMEEAVKALGTGKRTKEEDYEDDDFDDHQYIYTLDISVIATGFGQLVDEGKIDAKNKPLINLAINRQKIWAELADNWEYKDEYIKRMNVLERALKEA